MSEIAVYCPDCNKNSLIDTSNLPNAPYTNCPKCGSVNAHKIMYIVSVNREVSAYGKPKLKPFKLKIVD